MIVITHSVFLFVLFSISKDDQENNDFWRIAKAKHAPKNFHTKEVSKHHIEVLQIKIHIFPQVKLIFTTISKNFVIELVN